VAIKLPEHDCIENIVYVECGQLNKKGERCKNRLPLDKFGGFTGNCGRCFKFQSLRFWQLSESQRAYRNKRNVIREKVLYGATISIEEFDFVAKEFV
jgi:hypothetical protein